jgi:hypothetical protein
MQAVTAAEIIKGISLFEGLAPSEIEGVLCVCERVRFEPGAILMRQGQPADSAFIMESGAVNVMTRLPGGGEAGVATLGGPSSARWRCSTAGCGRQPWWRASRRPAISSSATASI